MTNIDDEIRSKLDTFATELVALVRRAALEAAAAALGGAPAAASAQAPTKRGRGRPKKGATPMPAAPTPAPAKRGRGRPKKGAAPAPSPAPVAKAPAVAKPAKAAAPTAAGAKKAATPKRALGEKRPPAELAKLTEKLGDYIKANPGKRMEAIGKALGTPTKELNLPVKKLLKAKKIRVQGEKRATEYFPA